MTKWIVSGNWKIDGKPGRLKVSGETMRAAIAAASEQGLDGLEALQAGDDKPKAPPRVAQKIRKLGLSKGETWAVGMIGLLLAPVGIGLAMIVWAILAQRQIREEST